MIFRAAASAPATWFGWFDYAGNQLMTYTNTNLLQLAANPPLAQNDASVATTKWVKDQGYATSGGGTPVSVPTYDVFTATASLAGMYTNVLANAAPSITEGNLIFTKSFTASNAAHRIRVRVSGTMSTNVAANGLTALHIDGGAAVRVQGVIAPSAALPFSVNLVWEGVLAAGAHTFVVRSGFTGAALYPNSYANSSTGIGNNTAAWVLTIEELLAP
jgi:hypothetical protein